MAAADWLFDRVVLDRVEALLRREPELRALVATAQDLDAIRAASSSIASFAAACERYGERVCFVERGRSDTYQAVWQRVRSLAGALVTRGVVPSQRVGIQGRPTSDWVVADLACLYVGAVSVPLHVGMAGESLRHAVRLAELEVILCDESERAALEGLRGECPMVREIVALDDPTHARSGAPALAPVVSRGDALVTVMFSSGSTGLPKGVMLTEARWLAQLRFALSWPRVPNVHVGYLPLSHITGRRLIHEVMMNGGVTQFPDGDATTLFDDVRRVRPTIVPVLPHIANLAYEHFHAERARLGSGGEDDAIAERVLANMRERFLGDRLCLIRTGTAPIAPEVLAFVERCFGVPVRNGYGSTELGSIALDGRMLPQHEYKLVDAPELGYHVTDTPPRGELYVRSAEATIGYLAEPQATADLFTPDDFVRTGDVVAEVAPGVIALLGRRKDVLRLAHGEFVNVGELETIYQGGSPLIRQMFVHGSPQRAALVAVIVPGAATVGSSDVAALKRDLRRELQRVAHARRLTPHQVPRDFIIETEPFTSENRLLGTALKLDRPRLIARYRDQLEALYGTIEARGRTGTRDGDVGQRVRAAVCALLGVEADEVAWSEIGFTGMGGDSLTAVQLCERVQSVVGVRPEVAVVLDPIKPLAELVAHVEELVRRGTSRTPSVAAHGDAAQLVHARDLVLDRSFDASAPRAFAPAPPRTVLLTGATGFLGASLLRELVEQLGHAGRVLCLVRAGDDRAALARVRATQREAWFDDAVAAGRVTVCAGDVMRPQLGMEHDDYVRLARDTDAVIHNAALVNHALSHCDLFEPNVTGTVEMMRFAIAQRRMPIHFISSIGLLDRIAGDEVVREDRSAEALWPTRAVGGPDDYATGYVTSKWAAEVLLGQLHARHSVPVSIFRCGVLLPDQRIAGNVNQRDALHRLLAAIVATRLAPDSFYVTSRVPPYLGGIPVDVAARAIVSIVNASPPDLARYHLDEVERVGTTLDTIVSAIEHAGISLERLPYATWYTRFVAALWALPEPARASSPLQIVRRWEQPIDPAARRRFDNARLRERLGVTATELAPLSPAYLAAWVAALRS